MRRRIVHIGLSLTLISTLAGALPAATAAADPAPDNPRLMRIEAGTHVGRQFDADGTITGSLRLTLQAPVTGHAIDRAWIPGRGRFLLAGDGPFAGYWLRESTVAYVRGSVGSVRYDPLARVAFPAGKVIGYRFDSDWRLVSAKIGTPQGSGADTDRAAIIDGRRYYRIVTGRWTGTWVPAGGTLRAKTLDCRAGPRADATRGVVRRVIGAGPEVALTFDMGGRLDPAVSIMRYLLLKGVCTTIFPTGSASLTEVGGEVLAMLKAYPQVFEVGNHTMYHCNLVRGGEGPFCPVSRPSPTRLRQELTDAAAIIEAGTGQMPVPYWRPPYGAYDAAVLDGAASVGYTTTAMWDVDTIDWRHVDDGGPTAAEIAAKVVDGTRTGSVVLMHLGGWNTRNALPWMLQQLRTQRDLVPTSLSDVLQPD
jgi:peptidoglycan/xylan/chitin deacetylase (PgdA/CDA1 family)